MENKEGIFIERKSSTSLRTNFTDAPLLTPTGKISHAKTRVYTQRYRKAWENMPDFKGWLTSVPDSPTRAFCTYCRKNLHAHRLSLLKHTCTMKHQRGALMYQKEALAKARVVTKEEVSQTGVESQQQNETDEQLEEHSMSFKIKNEDIEDDEEIEYVVERLDDEEIDEDNQSKYVEDDAEYVDDEEDDNLGVAKNIRTDESTKDHSDPLAEAMVHVHGDYMDESVDSVNVEMEMVVESVDPNSQELRIVSVQSIGDNEIHEECLDDEENSCIEYAHDQDKENDNNDHETVSHGRAGTISSCKSSVICESSDGVSEMDDPDLQMELVRQTPLSISARRNYLTRPSTARSISVLGGTTTENNGAGLLSGKKTITLTSGGKSVTIDSSGVTSYTGGSRYVSNVSKNQSAAGGNVVSEKNSQTPRQTEGQSKNGQQQHQQVTATPVTYSVAGGSQLAPRKQIILKSVKPLVPTKKPCISTHVLDTSKGHPVGGLQISLYKLMDGRWTFLNESTTTADGRCADLIDTANHTFTAGRYKLHFDVDKYFILRRIETMYPFIEIVFDIKNPAEHYHVPLLLSPFGYTTYRGS